MIAAHGIGWRIGGATILDDISVAVGAGELLGIIGPNGAGKSSLVNILSGVVRPTSGSIELAGHDVTRLSATARATKGLARSFQTSALFDGLTAGENVRLAIQGSRPGRLSLLRSAASSASAEQVEGLLDRVRMPGLAGAVAGALSHGDRRKLELAMAMASDPRVLLLDEPMAGVSAEDVDGLTSIIADVRDSGVAVLMVEHHIHVVLGLADRVAVVHHGRLPALGSADEVTADAEVQQAYLGEAL